MRSTISATILLVLATSYVQAGTWVYHKDAADHLRTQRSADHGHHAAPFGHGAPFGHAPVHHAPAHHGHTPIHQELHLNHGPVHHAPVHHDAYGHAPHHAPNPISTFVKTDPHANFKWGVKHLAGVQYGK